MNRRSFLKFGAAAAIGAAVLPALPVTPAAVAETAHVPVGLPALIDNCGEFQGISRLWYGLPLVADIDVPEDSVYFINLELFRQKPVFVNV